MKILIEISITNKTDWLIGKVIHSLNVICQRKKEEKREKEMSKIKKQKKERKWFQMKKRCPQRKKERKKERKWH